VCETAPLTASHASAVQGFASSVGMGSPSAHVPKPSQVSDPSHTVASLHDWPRDLGTNSH